MTVFMQLSDGKEYRIIFSQRYENETWCRLYEQTKDNRWNLFQTTISRCSRKDEPNKWFGRKQSLQRMMQHITGRDDRVKIWNAYWNVAATHILANNQASYVAATKGIRAMVERSAKIGQQWNQVINPKCIARQK